MKLLLSCRNLCTTLLFALFVLNSFPSFAETPDQILNLQMWLKADSVTKDASNKVSVWSDSHTTGNDASQATAANQPLWVDNIINGHPVLRFSGTEFLDTVAIPALDTAEVTLFIVFKSEDSGIKQRLVINSYTVGATANNHKMWGSYITDGKVYSLGRKSDGSAILIGNKIRDEWNIHTYLKAANFDFYNFLNASTVDSKSATADPTGHLFTRIGAVTEATPDQFFTGDIAEIIIYSRKLDDTERYSIEEYLNTKYSIDNKKPYTVLNTSC